MCGKEVITLAVLDRGESNGLRELENGVGLFRGIKIKKLRSIRLGLFSDNPKFFSNNEVVYSKESLLLNTERSFKVLKLKF